MKGEMERLKRKAATASLAFNLASAILKTIGAVLTGSVALLSEAMHSTIDVAASLIAFVSVRVSAVPPDEEHPYGHGKVESLTAFAEAVLLLGIVVFIFIEAVHRLVVGGTVQKLDLAVGLMALSTVGSLATATYVTKVAKKTRSLSLESNGQHLFVDFWTSLGVLVALAAAWLTGLTNVDALFALFVSIWLGHQAFRMATRSFHEIIDRRLPDDEIEIIRDLLDNAPGLLSYHRLRTRLSGMTRYVDLHIVVPNEWSLVEAHDLADDLEKRIDDALHPAIVVIHVDPFDAGKLFDEKVRAGIA